MDKQKNEAYKEALANAKTLPELGLDLNDKIEVRWLIERDGQPTPQTKWWGGRILNVDAEEPKLVTLLYDAAEEFEECEMKVLFTNESFLYDIEDGAEQPYRREGELINTSECEKAMDDHVTFKDLAEEEDGTEAVANEEISKLPHTVQVQVAERFEQFKSGFIDFLREKTEERGPNTVIKADDIADFVSKLKQKDSKP